MGHIEREGGTHRERERDGHRERKRRVREIDRYITHASARGTPKVKLKEQIYKTYMSDVVLLDCYQKKEHKL